MRMNLTSFIGLVRHTLSSLFESAAFQLSVVFSMKTNSAFLISSLHFNLTGAIGCVGGVLQRLSETRER